MQSKSVGWFLSDKNTVLKWVKISSQFLKTNLLTPDFFIGTVESTVSLGMRCVNPLYANVLFHTPGLFLQSFSVYFRGVFRTLLNI